MKMVCARRVFALLALVFAAAIFFAPGRAQAETLADALASAYQTSGLLQQNRALLRAADEDVAQALARMRPVLAYVLGANYSSITDKTTANLTLSASMLISDFGRSKLRREIAKENVLSLRAALVGVEQKVLLRAVSAYAGIQRDYSTVALRENNLRLFEEELKATRDRFDVGQITRTDVAQAEARLAGTKAALAAARGQLAVSREEYNAAIGHYPGKLAGLPRPPETARSLSQAQAIARKHHPDLAQAQHSVRVADLNVAVSEASIFPTLKATARATVDDAGHDNSAIGIELSGPIYQGGAIASAARKAAAQRDAARAGLHLAAAQVDQSVGSAWARLSVAAAQVTAATQRVRASRVALRGVREERDAGTRTTLDVLNAEQELMDAQAAVISANTDRYLAVYNLLASMGLLTADHLRLGVATYDPQAYYNAVQKAPTRRISPQGKRLDAILQSIGHE